MSIGGYVYMLRCADGSFYVGSTRADLETRISQHQDGALPECHTFRRRPVDLVWSAHFPVITDAIAAERQIKGWSRAKKQALVRGDWEAMRKLASRKQEGA